MSNFFTTLVYFETLSVFTCLSIVVGMKKKPKSSIYNNPAPTFWKKTDHFIAKHQSWSDHKIHQIQHKFLNFFVSFKNILFFAKIYFKNFQQSIFISLVFCNAYSMQATLDSLIVVVHGDYFLENSPQNTSLLQWPLLLIFASFPNSTLIKWVIFC